MSYLRSIGSLLLLGIGMTAGAQTLSKVETRASFHEAGTVRQVRMTFSSAITAAKTATFQSLSPHVTVPASITVPSGSTWDDFPVTVSSTAPDHDAWVLATVDGVTQRAYIPVVERDRITLTNFTVTAIPGGAWLKWTNPPITIARNGGPQLLISRTKITGTNSGVVKTFDLTDERTPLDGLQTEMVDSGLEVGAQYSYRVILKVSGQTSNIAATTIENVVVSGTPSITLSGIPSGTIEGALPISGADSAGKSEYTIYVDGVNRGTASSSDMQGGPAGQWSGVIDTTTLKNGLHTVVVSKRSLGSTNPQISSPVAISVQNHFSERYSDVILQIQPIKIKSPVTGLFTPDPLTAKPVVEVRSVLPPSTTKWRMEITSESSGSIVRTIYGDGSEARAIWDAKDSAGNYVADGNFSAKIYSGEGVTGDENVESEDDIRHFSKVYDSPQFLALMMLHKEGGPITDNSIAYYNHVRNCTDSLRTSSHRVSVIPWVYDKPVPHAVRWHIKLWMQYWTDKFYIYGHGSNAQTNGEQIVRWGNWNLANHSNAVNTFPQAPAWDMFNMSEGRPYKFAWIDACSSAGYYLLGPWNYMTSFPNTLWATALNINVWSGFNGAVMLWNGHDLLGYKRIMDGGTVVSAPDDVWNRYRKAFWTSIGGLNSVNDALIFATENCGATDAAYAPWAYNTTAQQYKLYYFGNAYLYN